MFRECVVTRSSSVLGLGLILFVTTCLASCGGATPATPVTATPTTVPATPTTVRLTPTSLPSTPTSPPAVPTKAGALAEVRFEWAPGGVRPSDSDDTASIIAKLIDHKGILAATGNESQMTVFYDPTLITVEQIQELFKQIGHPVVVRQ